MMRITDHGAIARSIPMSAVDCLPISAEWTFADLLEQLGHIPPGRIRLNPAPGRATEDDVLRAEGHTGRICELIDGVLVEKTTGYLESILAVAIIDALHGFVRARNLGIVLGPDGTLRILPGQVRAPDVSFVSWKEFPEGKLSEKPIPPIAPDLAVEILSEGNTEAEMQRKLRDYFAAGVGLVWYVDPRTKTVRAYTAPDHWVELDRHGVLDGAEVLPGFELSLAALWAEIEGKAGS